MKGLFHGFLAAALSGLLGALTPGIAAPADLLGLYVGAGAGQSQLRGDIDSYACMPLFSNCFPVTPPVSFERRTTGWEAFAGIQPLPFLGAEAEYIDFGSSGTTHVETDTVPGVIGIAATHPTAVALFAVGYLPIPAAHMDLFLKTGVADLRSDIHFSGLQGYCPGRYPCSPVGNLQSTVKANDARPVYGAGAQMKWGHLSARAGYERVSASTGDPSLLSLGLTWGF